MLRAVRELRAAYRAQQYVGQPIEQLDKAFEGKVLLDACRLPYLPVPIEGGEARKRYLLTGNWIVIDHRNFAVVMTDADFVARFGADEAEAAKYDAEPGTTITLPPMDARRRAYVEEVLRLAMEMCLTEWPQDGVPRSEPIDAVHVGWPGGIGVSTPAMTEAQIRAIVREVLAETEAADPMGGK